MLRRVRILDGEGQVLNGMHSVWCGRVLGGRGEPMLGLSGGDVPERRRRRNLHGLCGGDLPLDNRRHCLIELRRMLGGDALAHCRVRYVRRMPRRNLLGGVCGIGV